jgi:chaperonin GroES
MKLKPLSDKIVVCRQEAAEKKGGIIIPDQAREKPQRGEVLAVGPGKVLDNGERCAMQVKVGQVVLFGRYAGNEITDVDERTLILREEDILAVVE